MASLHPLTAPPELGLRVQGCKPKSIIQAEAEGVFPGGRAREQGTHCLPGLGQLAEATLRTLCAGSRQDGVDGSALKCKPKFIPTSQLRPPLGTHTGVSLSEGCDVHIFLAAGMTPKGAKLCYERITEN